MRTDCAGAGIFSRIILLFTLPLWIPLANAALVIDQESFTSGSVVSGGVNFGIQSFQPTADNLAGLDVYLYSVNAPANITFSLYQASGPEDFGYASNPVLASDTFLLDTGTGTTGWAEFRFSAVSVIPDTYYIMELTTDNGVFGVASSNPYSRGQRLEPGIQRDYFDIRFVTYADSEFSAVPLPASAWLFLSAVGGLCGLKHRR